MDHSLRTLIVCLFLFWGAVLHAAPDLAAQASAARQRGEMFIQGADGRRFLPAEIDFLGKLASPEISRMCTPAMEAIADFSEQLKARGVSLIVVPVPPKALFSGDSLGLTPGQEQLMRRGWETIMSELSARGVVVEDLSGDFAQAGEDPFCRRDTHWSGRGIDLAAKRIAAALSSRAGIVVQPASGELKTLKIRGDLGGDPEEISLRFPGMASDPDASRKHPVLLLGDSHLLVFHVGGDLHASGAGLADQLASSLGSSPDMIAVRGSGATSSRMNLARRARREPGYLEDKKVVVWCFAGRDFTEASEWKKIPLLKTSNGS